MRMLIPFFCLFVTLVFAGCKSASVAGTYNIQQDNNVFGEGADKAELVLGEDKKYTLTIGPLTLASGTWSEADGSISLSQGQGQFGTTYKVQGDKLIPIANGTEMTTWRFIKKP